MTDVRNKDDSHRFDTMRKFLSTFWNTGEVRGIRALYKKGKTDFSVSQYFNDIEKCVLAIPELERRYPKYTIYVELNACNPALLARNETNKWVEGASTTADIDIGKLEYLLIDVDPTSISGISSSTEELPYAQEVAENIKKDLGSPMVYAMSGNGFHLIYRHNLTENSEQNIERLKSFLQVLGKKYNKTNIDKNGYKINTHIDLKCFNPARITKLIGVWAKKGQNSEERPHRVSYLIESNKDAPAIEIPDIPAKEVRTKASNNSSFSSNKKRSSKELVTEVLDNAGLQYDIIEHSTGLMFLLKKGYFESSHEGKEWIHICPDETILFKCKHNSCGSRTWDEFKSSLGLLPSQKRQPILCKHCAEEITFFDNKVSRNGKKIPCNIDGSNHECQKAPKKLSTAISVPPKNNELPAIKNEIPAIKNEIPAIKNEIPAIKTVDSIPSLSRCNQCDEETWYFADKIHKSGKKYPCDKEGNKHKCDGKAIGSVKKKTVENRGSELTIYDCMDGKRVIRSMVVDHLYNKLSKQGLISHEGCFWEYGDGYWSMMDKVIIEKEILEFCGEHCTSALIACIYNQMLIKAHSGKKKFEFNPDKNLICLKNYTLNTYTMQILPHNKEHYINFKINVSWGTTESTKSCPTWLTYLTNTGLHEDTKNCLQEFMGYCFTSRVSELEGILFLKGGGGDGKSTFIETLGEIIGPEASCSIEPAEFESEYMRDMLHGKILNICSDIKHKFAFGNRFKGIVTGDKTSARKIQHAPYNFYPIAKHVFSANSFPLSEDKSYGFFRRFYVVEFKRSFTKEFKHLRIKNLKEKLRSEHDGIFNWAMEGLQRLITNNWKPTESQEMQEALGQFEFENSTLLQFLDECIHDISTEFERDSMQRYSFQEILIEIKKENNIDFYIKTHKFRKIYENWCDGSGHKELGDSNLGKELLAKGVKKDRIKKKGERDYYYIFPSKVILEIIKEEKGTVLSIEQKPVEKPVEKTVVVEKQSLITDIIPREVVVNRINGNGTTDPVIAAMFKDDIGKGETFFGGFTEVPLEADSDSNDT